MTYSESCREIRKLLYRKLGKGFRKASARQASEEIAFILDKEPYRIKCKRPITYRQRTILYTITNPNTKAISTERIPEIIARLSEKEFLQAGRARAMQESKPLQNDRELGKEFSRVGVNVLDLSEEFYGRPINPFYLRKVPGKGKPYDEWIDDLGLSGLEELQETLERVTRSAGEGRYLQSRDGIQDMAQAEIDDYLQHARIEEETGMETIPF